MWWGKVGVKGGGGGGVGWGAEGWGPEGWGAQNFALFFPSPAGKFVLFFTLWGSSRGILVVFEAPGEAPGRTNVHVWMCEPRRPGLVGPPGFHTTTAPQTPPKFNEKTPREGRKERILRRERDKKERKIWAVPGKGGPREGRSREGRSREGWFRGHNMIKQG